MENILEMLKLVDYGALKIDFRQNEGNKYYVYGFKNDADYWDFENGDLLTVTEHVEFIKLLQEKFNTISNDFKFCRCCFKNKKVVESFYSHSVQEWVPNEVLIQIQNNLLKNKLFSWRRVSLLPSWHAISCLFCETCGKGQAFWDYENNNDIATTFAKVIKQEVSRHIINNPDEKILEHYLSENIGLIEKGMIFIESQKRIDNGAGFIDIFAKDINDRLCVIELKVTPNDKNVVYQAAYYQSEIGEDIRVIIIASDYSSSILKALKNVRNTELMVYNLNNEDLLQVEDYIKEEVILVENPDFEVAVS